MKLSVFVTFILVSACSITSAESNKTQFAHVAEVSHDLNAKLDEIVKEHKINTAAVAIIKGGEVVWEDYFGYQSPGVPASSETLFNVASITKTVTAETALRLAADRKISLDESISAYWVDPDLEDDARHSLLTPRMLLSHTSGFMNWRFFADDGKLAFVDEPGTTFGYSGEGFEYLARFIEAKMQMPFEDIARDYGIQNVMMRVNSDNFEQIAQTRDTEGNFPGYYCRPEGWCRSDGDFSAAGGMAISLKDYADFFIQSMRGDRLSANLVAQRSEIVAPEDAYDCSPVPEALCPIRSGYGLGWHVFELKGDRAIGHLGSDWSMVTMAYYYEGSRDGLIVFFNAPNRNGIAAMVDALRLLDPDSQHLHGYIARRARSHQ